MRFKFLFLVLFYSILFLSAQVGINTLNPLNGVLHIDGGGNNALVGEPTSTEQKDDIFINNLGNVAIGHLNPAYKLDVKTDGNMIKIADGSEDKTKILMSDDSGYGIWGYIGGLDKIEASLGDGFNFTIAPQLTYGNFTVIPNTTLSLPPGRWLVYINILLELDNVLNLMNDYGQNCWIRTTFSDTSINPSPSKDLMGADQASGHAYPKELGKIVGFLVINNTTNKVKTYYYTFYVFTSDNILPTAMLKNFASKDIPENKIFALKISD